MLMLLYPVSRVLFVSAVSCMRLGQCVVMLDLCGDWSTLAPSEHTSGPGFFLKQAFLNVSSSHTIVVVIIFALHSQKK